MTNNDARHALHAHAECVYAHHMIELEIDYDLGWAVWDGPVRAVDWAVGSALGRIEVDDGPDHPDLADFLAGE